MFGLFLCRSFCYRYIFSLWAHCSCLAAIVWINCVDIILNNCVHFSIFFFYISSIAPVCRLLLLLFCVYIQQFSIWHTEKLKKKRNTSSINEQCRRQEAIYFKKKNVVIISIFFFVCVWLDNPGQNGKIYEKKSHV